MALRASARLVSRTLRSVAPRALSTSLLAPPPSRSFSSAQEDVVKDTFIKQQTQFRQYLMELEKINIPVSAEDEKAVKEYSESLKGIRKKVGVPSFSEKLSTLLESAAEEADEVRTYLEEARTIRREIGIDDSLKVEEKMFSALDKVEKDLGKPLTTSDARGLALFEEQIAAINSQLGLKESELESLESSFELDLARNDIKIVQKEATEKMDTYKRRDGLESVEVPLKELDPRPYY